MTTARDAGRRGAGLGGVYAAVPTPFHDDGVVDPTAMAALVSAYGEAGVDGFVVLGMGGEVAALDERERAAVIAAARRAAGGLPLVVGLAPGEEPSRAILQAAVGLAGVLLVITAEDPAHQQGRLEAVAALGPPLLVDHLPTASGQRLPHGEALSLVLAAPVAAVVTETPPTPDLVAAVVRASGPPVLGGLAGLYLLEELESGAAGCVAGLATPERLVEVVADWRRGDPGRARERYLELLGWLRLEAMPAAVGLVVRKEAWRQRGVIGSSRVRRGEPLQMTTKMAITRRLQEIGVPTPSGIVLG